MPLDIISEVVLGPVSFKRYGDGSVSFKNGSGREQRIQPGESNPEWYARLVAAAGDAVVSVPEWVGTATIGGVEKTARLHVKFDTDQYWINGETSFAGAFNYQADSSTLYQNSDGDFAFSSVGVPVLTDRGALFWRQTIHTLHFSRDLRVNYKITLSSISVGEFFTDGETVTTSAGGSGVYCAAGETGTTHTVGNWTGTPPALGHVLTGANAVGTVGSSVTPQWVHNNVTVTKDQVGLDGTENGACKVVATAANASITQAITHFSQSGCSSFFMRRLVGSGAIGLTLDGTTFDDRTVTESTFARFVSETITQANTTPGFRIATSGDSIVVDFAANSKGGPTQAECYDGDIGLGLAQIPTTTKSAQVVIAPNQMYLKKLLSEYVDDITKFTVVSRYTPMSNVPGGTVVAFDNDGGPDYVAIQNYAAAGVGSDRHQGVTYETPSNLGGFGNDPPNELAIHNIEHTVAWSTNANDIGAGKARVKIVSNGDLNVISNQPVSYIPANLAFMRVGMMWDTTAPSGGFPGINHIPGYVREIMVFDGEPSDAELTALAPEA